MYSSNARLQLRVLFTGYQPCGSTKHNFRNGRRVAVRLQFEQPPATINQKLKMLGEYQREDSADAEKERVEEVEQELLNITREHRNEQAEEEGEEAPAEYVEQIADCR